MTDLERARAFLSNPTGILALAEVDRLAVYRLSCLLAEARAEGRREALKEAFNRAMALRDPTAREKMAEWCALRMKRDAEEGKP